MCSFAIAHDLLDLLHGRRHQHRRGRVVVPGAKRERVAKLGQLVRRRSARPRRPRAATNPSSARESAASETDGAGVTVMVNLRVGKRAARLYAGRSAEATHTRSPRLWNDARDRDRSAGRSDRLAQAVSGYARPMRPAALKAPADGFTSQLPADRFDALLVVSFGGPEGPEDVIPFLENVTRGRDVPQERLEEVARHYERLRRGQPPQRPEPRADRRPPHRARPARHRPTDLPRKPELGAAARGHAPRDGRRGRRARACVLHVRVLVVLGLQAIPGEHPRGPAGGRAERPGGVEDADVLQPPAAGSRRMPTMSGALSSRSRASAARRARRLHRPFDPTRDGASVPLRGSAAGERAPRRGGRRCSRPHPRVPEPERPAAGSLARAGHPRAPARPPRSGVDDVVVSPLGFVSDHVEVLYDLDLEARGVAAELGLNFVRAATASTHPAFVSMISELVEERLDPRVERRAIGRFSAGHDVCPEDCCLPGTGRPSPWALEAPGSAATPAPPLPAP